MLCSSCDRRSSITRREQMSLLLLSLFSGVVVTCSWSSNCGRRERVLAKSCLQSGSDAGLGEQQNSCRVLMQLALDAHTSSAAESSAKHSDPHCTCTHTYIRFFQLDSSRFFVDLWPACKNFTAVFRLSRKTSTVE